MVTWKPVWVGVDKVKLFSVGVMFIPPLPSLNFAESRGGDITVHSCGIKNEIVRENIRR